MKVFKKMIPKRSFGPLFYFSTNFRCFSGKFFFGQSFAFSSVNMSKFANYFGKKLAIFFTSPIFVLKNPALDQVIQK
jgi:hypothetical protein